MGDSTQNGTLDILSEYLQKVMSPSGTAAEVLTKSKAASEAIAFWR